MRSILLCSLLFSTTALAQTLTAPPADVSPRPSPLVGDGPGNGLQLELNVFGGNSFTGLSTLVGVATGGTLVNLGGVLAVSPTALVGYQFDQNDILVGLAFAANGGAGTTIGFSIDPTYRRYFTPLRTGAVSPFAQGSLAFGIIAPNAGPSNIEFGIGGGAGAEWLFVKNLGLVADLEMAYVHINAGANTDSIGFSGNVGLAVHL